ncbi:hypothetical protein B0A67_12535 [Flavobacterium aquidurense]|uniref:hypothetical protein n=1 Tax=Flavobacterium aquidurense TaxID=362413 RepID=UPI0009209AED|nr:hypothetical protein [Flavobacterium aquidurense]OXA71095.1 hypothetical protein B0A67_12535 [Flavobacterium aquidurense]SHG63981.1 hypothetical protein SAMN05444481_10647 [Flavobacterium frigidimaris]
MKKNLLIVSMVLLTASLFIGCSSDSADLDTNPDNSFNTPTNPTNPTTPDNSKLLAGEMAWGWVLKSRTNDDNYDSKDYLGVNYFLSGGVFKFYSRYGLGSISSGTWEMDKNTLTITKKVYLPYVPISYTIKSINDTELVLVQNSTGDTSTYSRYFPE